MKGEACKSVRECVSCVPGLVLQEKHKHDGKTRGPRNMHVWERRDAIATFIDSHGNHMLRPPHIPASHFVLPSTSAPHWNRTTRFRCGRVHVTFHKIYYEHRDYTNTGTSKPDKSEAPFKGIVVEPRRLTLTTTCMSYSVQSSLPVRRVR